MLLKEVVKVQRRRIGQKNNRKFQTTGWEVQSPHMQIIQIDLKFLIQLIKTISLIKFQRNKPSQIFIDSVSNITPLYDLLNEVIKDLYDLKIINSDQVIKLETLIKRSLKSLSPKRLNSIPIYLLRNMHHSVDLFDLEAELKT